MSNRWDGNAIEYNDVDALKEALVGREILGFVSEGLGTYRGSVQIQLDNGDVLTGWEADGGCACSNGCFDLTQPEAPKGTVMNVEVEETEDGYESGTIRLFVYTEFGRTNILESSGSDNGYYGWGYHLTLNKKEEA